MPLCTTFSVVALDCREFGPYRTFGEALTVHLRHPGSTLHGPPVARTAPAKLAAPKLVLGYTPPDPRTGLRRPLRLEPTPVPARRFGDAPPVRAVVNDPRVLDMDKRPDVRTLSRAELAAERKFLEQVLRFDRHELANLPPHGDGGYAATPEAHQREQYLCAKVRVLSERIRAIDEREDEMQAVQYSQFARRQQLRRAGVR